MKIYFLTLKLLLIGTFCGDRGAGGCHFCTLPLDTLGRHAYVPGFHGTVMNREIVLGPPVY